MDPIDLQGFHSDILPDTMVHVNDKIARIQFAVALDSFSIGHRLTASRFFLRYFIKQFALCQQDKFLSRQLKSITEIPNHDLDLSGFYRICVNDLAMDLKVFKCLMYFLRSFIGWDGH